MGIDITKLVGKAQDLVGKLNRILPEHWKGNDAPNTHHWDAGSIRPTASLDTDKQELRLLFDFMDQGTGHTIAAVMPFAEIGHGDLAEVLLDGVAQANPRVVFSHREGLENFDLYSRVVVEFHFTGPDGAAHDYRFDGDLA